MTRRALYIVAYDVAKPSRLRKVHRTVKRFATGGQKSVFESGTIINEDETAN